MMTDEEKMVREVVRAFVAPENREIVVGSIMREVLGHPADRDRTDDNLYSDVQNQLGDDKPKYLDPQMQRRQ